MRLLFILTLSFMSGLLAAEESVPVIVGGNGDIDACMSVGEIKNSAAKVRKGPSAKYTETDLLEAGRIVWLCSNNGQWVGIVYPSINQGTCEVSSPINPEQPYKGKCNSGWILESDIELAAG